jgi:hypothetical protein
MSNTKSESKWYFIIVDDKTAEFVGVVTAPDADTAERRAAAKFRITGERRKRLVGQLALH